MVSQQIDDDFPWDVIDGNEASNPARISGSVSAIGYPDEPVRDKWPNWLAAELLQGTGNNSHTALEYGKRNSYVIKADKDGSLWWFDNYVEKNPFRGSGCMFRPYVFAELDVEATEFIGLIKQVTMCDGNGSGIHFPVGHKVSFVPMRVTQLMRNEDGKPIVMHKSVDEDVDMTWPLTLPSRAAGVATEVIQDLPIHQPTKLTRQESPVLEFRRHSHRRLPTSVSKA